MLNLIGTLLGGATGILKLISGIFVSLSNEKIATINAEATVQTASIQGMAAVETKWDFAAMMIPCFAVPYAIYTCKAVAWDNVIAPILGRADITAPLTGDLQTVFLIVVSGIFLHAWIGLSK